VNKKLVFSLLTGSLILSAIEIQPVSANPRWEKMQRFQQEKVQPFLDKHRIKLRGTYTPPKSPVSIGCDTQGNASVFVNPGVSTPLGRFGVNASYQLNKKCR
jgi:hypothetical protein